jgi:hypothetical protein
MSKKEKRPNKRVKNSILRNEKIIIDMTRKQFENVPKRETWHENVVCDSIVIMPLKKIHDSGYRYLDFVAIKSGEPLFRLSGCSDALHIEGIGGSGERKNGIFSYYDLVDRKAWNMDCLPKSGLLRIWVDNCELVCGPSLSSFEIYSRKRT